MPSIRMGLKKSSDFLEKARRELERYASATDGIDKADHVLNLAITIHHLADWTYYHGTELGLELGNKGDFLHQARNASEPVRLLRKIADTTKHHTLTQQSALRIEVEEIGEERVRYYQDIMFTEAQAPLTSVPGAGVVAVRTVIDDDNIVAYDSTFQGTVVTSSGQDRLYGPMCVSAISFWEDTIADIDKGKIPEWLTANSVSETGANVAAD